MDRRGDGGLHDITSCVWSLLSLVVDGSSFLVSVEIIGLDVDSLVAFVSTATNGIRGALIVTSGVSCRIGMMGADHPWLCVVTVGSKEVVWFSSVALGGGEGSIALRRNRRFLNVTRPVPDTFTIY